MYCRKKITKLFLLALIFSASFLYGPGLAEVRAGDYSRGVEITVTADSAVLMDADTGQVLYAKNPHQPRPIASTTKIMTALLAIESGDLNQVVTVSPHAAGVEGSSVYLRAGERLTLEELLYGALMNSGNDACVAIAEHVAGREDIFVCWMNCKARLMGLKTTNFANTNGLPNKDHLSSAWDLATIARHALKNTVFNRIVSTRSHTISGHWKPRQLSNTNQMLWGYQGADGVKTGTTGAAGKCLVSSASRNGRRLIAVVLHSDSRYDDSKRLLDYGFANFESERVAESGQAVSCVSVTDGVKNTIPVGSMRDVAVTVPVRGEDRIEKVITVDREIKAPVRSGVAAGRLLVLVGGQPVAETGLVTLESVEKLPPLRLVYQKMWSFIEPSIQSR